MTLQANLDCAHASLNCFDVNCDGWMMVRTACKYLLGAGDLDRYRELRDEDDDENCQTEWAELLEKFDPDNKDAGSSNYEGQANLRDDFENNLKVMSERFIAYHQLKAFSMYLKDKPDMSEAYHKFLVSIYSFLDDMLLS